MGATAIYTTRQIQAGNALAVCLPDAIAYPPDTELVLTRVDQKIIIEPKNEEPQEETMAGFVDWLTSLPRSAKFERVDVEFDPEEKWRV